MLISSFVSSGGSNFPRIHSYTLSACPVDADNPHLQHYIRTGACIKNSDTDIGIAAVEEAVKVLVEDVAQTSSGPSVFGYVVGSSGLGKSQVAFALQRDVLYLPLSEWK